MNKIQEAAERAYGLLWCETGGCRYSHEARRVLLDAIDKAGQRRGIEYARENRPRKAPIGVTAIWLKRLGDKVVVEAEVEGRWVEIISEHHDGSYSHIAESGGIMNAVLRSIPTPTEEVQ